MTGTNRVGTGAARQAFAPIVVLALGWSAAVARAQPAFPPPKNPLHLVATRAAGPIVVDGRLDEGDWARAEVAGRFVQAEPRQGDPATEPTEVRVLFDASYLYIGVVCIDSHGAGDLRVRDLRRDFDDTFDDYFGIAIDGVQDGRSATVFRVNPRGALRDQQTVDGGLADVDFDAVWTARTTRGDRGWIAEIAIPWQTLRYRAGADTWNINFHRVNRRLNESSGWSPWPRVMEPFRMDYSGRLTSVVPPPPGRNLRLQPYAVGEGRRGAGPVAAGTDQSASAGTDLKWAVTPNSVLDLTLNPDFGQSDVDRQVVNLTRFSVFFPERRQFFLENRGVFLSGNGSRFEPFFSRRIGLDEAGEPIPIRAGARLTSRSADHAFGVLALSQGGDGTDAEFGVVRYVRNFSGQTRRPPPSCAAHSPPRPRAVRAARGLADTSGRPTAPTGVTSAAFRSSSRPGTRPAQGSSSAATTCASARP